MTREVEANHSAELQQEVTRIHDVDGIAFLVSENHIHGGGWQGRNISFLSTDLEVISKLIQIISTKPVRGPSHSDITVRQENEPEIIFKVYQSDGWVEANDQSELRHLAFANNDVPALIHVFEQFNALLDDDDPNAEHFCEEFGVEDDD